MRPSLSIDLQERNQVFQEALWMVELGLYLAALFLALRLLSR